MSSIKKTSSDSLQEITELLEKFWTKYRDDELVQKNEVEIRTLYSETFLTKDKSVELFFDRFDDFLTNIFKVAKVKYAMCALAAYIQDSLRIHINKYHTEYNDSLLKDVFFSDVIFPELRCMRYKLQNFRMDLKKEDKQSLRDEIKLIEDLFDLTVNEKKSEYLDTASTKLHYFTICVCKRSVKAYLWIEKMALEIHEELASCIKKYKKSEYDNWLTTLQGQNINNWNNINEKKQKVSIHKKCQEQNETLPMTIFSNDADEKPLCPMGDKCSNKLLKHRQKFVRILSKELCRFGSDCDITTENHFEDFFHPGDDTNKMSS